PRELPGDVWAAKWGRSCGSSVLVELM
ncbi:hypothetical protein Q604_UNBC03762G0001, partial [human gut metagenome]